MDTLQYEVPQSHRAFPMLFITLLWAHWVVVIPVRLNRGFWTYDLAKSLAKLSLRPWMNIVYMVRGDPHDKKGCNELL